MSPQTLTYYRVGMGDTTQQISATTQAALGALAATPKAIATIATALGVSVPIVGWAVAGLTLAVPYIINQFRGCGATCTAATHIADEAEHYLKANLDGYFSGPRTVTSRAVAIDTAQKLLAAVQQGCGNAALMEAGQRCISERLIEGGTAPWCPTADHRGCDWITLYLKPIVNDVPVADSSISGGTDPFNDSGMPSAIGGGDNTMLLIGALAVFVLIVATN